MNLDAKTLQQKSCKILKVAISTSTLFVVFILLLFFLIKKDRVAIMKLKQTATQLEVEKASVSQTRNFLIQQKESIAQFEKTLPGEKELVDFVKSVEFTAQDFATGHTLHFSNTLPLKEQNNLFVPFTLQLKMRFSQVVPFLRRFERIAYLTHITSLELQQDGDGEDFVTVNIRAKVYVQKPTTP